ncbi:hypothetical protein SZ39_4912 [Bacillus mycoides]|nr:hypothetical protein SZ39_4912 [Bacillus mycoides]
MCISLRQGEEKRAFLSYTCYAQKIIPPAFFVKKEAIQ